MAKNVVILGAGFGGLEAATLLAQSLPLEYQITLIDQSSAFFFGFSKFDVMFGRKTEAEILYPYSHLKEQRIQFKQDRITDIDVEGRLITTDGGEYLYDFLIVALGADLNLGAVPGFIQSGNHEFYSLEGARMLGKKLRAFGGGSIVLSIFSQPYKCPPAPFEGILQIHNLYEELGIREMVDLKVCIPTPSPLPVSPQVSEYMESLLAQNNIELLKLTKIARVEFSQKVALAENGSALPYDLFIGVPVHVPPSVVKDSGLSESGFLTVNPKNMETAYAGIYALGDVTAIPAGSAAVAKAGVFAEDGARAAVADILTKTGVSTPGHHFQGQGACYFEFGKKNVAKISANFLGGPQPVVELDTSLENFYEDKQQFIEDRAARWFNL